MTTTPSPIPESDLTASLADQIAELVNRGLSGPDTEQVRRLMLDSLGVALRGAALPWARDIADWSRRFFGTGAAPVIGTGASAAASVAALVHGTAAHGYELDDTHDETMSHPACTVLPAALAVGAETGASQRLLFVAIAAGYEAMARAGLMAHGLHVIEGGFHPTPVFGSFGAATACVVLLHGEGKPIDPGKLITAWGHALSQTSGTMQFSVDPAGGAVKRLHAGYAARNGVMAAELAMESGIGTPRRSLDGRYGLARMFGGAVHAAPPRQAQEPLQIHRISLKPYSCCRIFHSTIDALGEVTEAYSTPVERIRRIVVRGPRLIEDQHMMRRPRSVMAAQYSCPYLVGASLAYGPSRYDAYSDAHLDDPRILEIADLVHFEYDAELEAMYPKQFPTAVTITFADGSIKTSLVKDSFGTPAKPMTADQIAQKARSLLMEIDSEVDVEACRERIWNDGTDARTLASIMAGR
ncbi:MAG: MmgE/PrpD family protein [Alcaligenaceae bacterium]|nr:MmgE/PrpD family protein [Alcaligenaceae bacterium]